MKKLCFAGAVALLAALAAACGDSQPAPVTPAPAPAPTRVAKVEPKPDAKPVATEPPPPPEPTPPPAETHEEPKAAPPCDPTWVCLTINEATKKVEKRPTALLGDPAFESTLSQTTDGRTPAEFHLEDGRTVTIALKRTGGQAMNKADLVMKTSKGADVVIDKRTSGDDFLYVGFVAAAKGDAIYVDLRYMK